MPLDHGDLSTLNPPPSPTAGHVQTGYPDDPDRYAALKLSAPHDLPHTLDRRTGLPRAFPPATKAQKKSARDAYKLSLAAEVTAANEMREAARAEIPNAAARLKVLGAEVERDQKTGMPSFKPSPSSTWDDGMPAVTVLARATAEVERRYRAVEAWNRAKRAFEMLNAQEQGAGEALTWARDRLRAVDSLPDAEIPGMPMFDMGDPPTEAHRGPNAQMYIGRNPFV